MLLLFSRGIGGRQKRLHKTLGVPRLLLHSTETGQFFRAPCNFPQFPCIKTFFPPVTACKPFAEEYPLIPLFFGSLAHNNIFPNIVGSCLSSAVRSSVGGDFTLGLSSLLLPAKWDVICELGNLSLPKHATDDGLPNTGWTKKRQMPKNIFLIIRLVSPSFSTTR